MKRKLNFKIKHQDRPVTAECCRHNLKVLKEDNSTHPILHLNIDHMGFLRWKDKIIGHIAYYRTDKRNLLEIAGLCNILQHAKPPARTVTLCHMVNSWQSSLRYVPEQYLLQRLPA